MTHPAGDLFTEVPERSGLCCDFDGTIAPIVVDPQTARAVPGAVAALHELARELAVVAAVSGRPAAFLGERLELTSYRSPLRAIGLHGLEECLPDGSVRVRAGVTTWRPVIEEVRDQLLAAVPEGVRVEDKGYGVTVHWRSVSASGSELEATAARSRAVARAISAAHGLLARPGKSSVELALPLGIDKGTVLRELCGGLERAGYLGDDDGDLLAFHALDELKAGAGVQTLKIAVAGAEAPAALVAQADLVLDGPVAAAGFLSELAGRLRPR